MRPEGADLGEVCERVLDLVEPLGGRGGLLSISSRSFARPRVTLIFADIGIGERWASMA